MNRNVPFSEQLRQAEQAVNIQRELFLTSAMLVSDYQEDDSLKDQESDPQLKAEAIMELAHMCAKADYYRMAVAHLLRLKSDNYRDQF